MRKKLYAFNRRKAFLVSFFVLLNFVGQAFLVSRMPSRVHASTNDIQDNIYDSADPDLLFEDLENGTNLIRSASELVYDIRSSSVNIPTTTKTPSDTTNEVTLITGDVVVFGNLSDLQRNIAIIPVDQTDLGRHFLTYDTPKGTYVIPSDIDLDKFDIELFNVKYLIEEGYYNMTSMPIIINVVEIDETFEQTLKNKMGNFERETIKPLKKISSYAVQIPTNKIKDVKKILLERKDVKKIWLDKKIHTSLIDSVPLIGASELWDAGYNGTGVEIAILDTGIDETHPDLDDLDDDPGTTDPKVIREIDFTDDHTTDDLFGHGTHCAGIAAGTGYASGGGNKGVAPGALLWNVKVLNRYGSGLTSWIIDGIEYAAYGPDGMANTGDEADVISMSLGEAPTDGTDPLSLAVDAAVDAGVVVVIAAGNDYDYFQVSSPGSARNVITVGASDKYDELAYFSSKGPTIDLRVKPDVLAPGVQINSSVPYEIYSNYYQPMSGTSMATPHVAGTAALMLQKGVPAGWTAPEYIKNALISTAVDLGYDVYAQGGGRIYVPSAASTEILVDPATVSFGYYFEDTLRNTTLTLHNLNTTSSHNLSLSVSVEEIYTGVLVDCAFLNTTTLNLDPNSYASILLTINTTVPKSVYSGKILATLDTGETVHTIFGFSKVNKLTVTKLDLTGAPAVNHRVDVVGETGLPVWFYGYTDGDGNATFYVPDGTFHVISTGSDDNLDATIYTIAENVSVTEYTVVHLDERDTLVIDFDMNKPDQIMAEKNSGLFYEEEQRGIWFTDLWWYPTSAITYISPTSINAGFAYGYYPEVFCNIEDPGIINTPEWHKLLFTLEGVTGGTTLIADYDSLARRTTDYKVALASDVAERVYHVFDPIAWGSFTFRWRMNAPQNRIEWLSPEPVRNFGWYSEWEYQSNWNWGFSEPYRSYPTGEVYIALGEHPFTSGADLYVEPGYMELIGSISSDTFGNSFANLTRNVSGHLTVILDDVEAYATDIRDYFYEYVNIMGTPKVKVIIDGSCGLNLSRNTRTELEFVADYSTDYRPPNVAMRPLDSELNCTLQPGVTALNVKVLDDGTISSVSLEYSFDEGATWNPASLVQVGTDTWVAEFNTLSNTYVSLRVNATDSNGNKISQSTIKGFYVGWGEQAHDLHVSLEAPYYLPLGSSSLLNATVHNVGQQSEAGVELYLFVNGSVMTSTTIPILVNGTSQTISYFWTPPTEGYYNVTVYAPPVPGEDRTTNNLVSRTVCVGEKVALISYYSELTEVTHILDSMGVVYDIYNDNYANRYTEDIGLLLDYGTVIYNNRYGLTGNEYAALQSYLSSGGDLLVTGFDSLISDPLLADLVRSSSYGDNVGEPDLYVVDPSHPIMNGTYGSFPEGYHVSGLYSDCDAVEADSSRGAVSVAELADGYDKIIATYVSPGKVVYWNGKGPDDWRYNADCEAMFKNTLAWFKAEYQHDLAVSLETPLYILPGDGCLLNVTVSNYGLDDESDVVVQLLVNGTAVLDEIIPLLVSGASTTLSQSWTPAPGWYNVTAIAQAVLGEEYTGNNRAYGWVDVSSRPRHVGDIVVEGDEVLVIEDLYFTQKGNIIVRDNAMLVIRNATLNLDQDYWRQYQITVSGSATLWTEDAYIVSDYWFNTLLMDSAEGLIYATFFGDSWDHPPVDPMGYIDVENDAVLDVYGSTLGYLHCFDYSTISVYGSYIIGLGSYGYSVASVYDSDIEWTVYVSPWGGSDVLLEGCTVGCPILGFLGTASSSELSSTDPAKNVLIYEDGFLKSIAGEEGVHPHMLNETNPDVLHKSWLDPHWRGRSLEEKGLQGDSFDGSSDASSSAVVTLTGLYPGYIGFWNIHLNETVSGVDWNMTLIDTTVTIGWELECYEVSEVSVYDSILLNLYCYDDSVVSVYDSVIEWAVFVSPWGGSDVLLEGCTVGYPRLEFKDYSSASLTGLNSRYIGFWNIYVNGTVSGIVWNMTLVDTEVTEGWALRCYDDSVVSVYDSTLLYLDCSDYSMVSVNNSNVYGLYCGWFTGQLFFDETIVNGWWDIYYSQFYMEGGVNFTNIYLWFWNSEVTRNYGVEAEAGGSPIPGVALTLYDEWGTPLWGGTTDSSGHADFNLTYTDGNYTTVCKLRTDEYPLETEVKLLTDTPILFNIITAENLQLVVRGNNDRIYYNVFEDGSTWTGWVGLPGKTCDRPVATVQGGKLHLVVRSITGKGIYHGWVDLSTQSFSGWIRLSGDTPSAPALTASSSSLFLVVRGFNDRIYYRSYVGGTWSSWVALPGRIYTPPSATVVSDQLHLVVIGGYGRMFHGWVELSTNYFSGWVMMSGSTPSTPALADDESSVYLIVRGNNDRVYMRRWNGSWGGWTGLPGATCDGPGAAVLSGELHLAVKGTTGGLFHGWIDLSSYNFSGWTRLPGDTPSQPTLTAEH